MPVLQGRCLNESGFSTTVTWIQLTLTHLMVIMTAEDRNLMRIMTLPYDRYGSRIVVFRTLWDSQLVKVCDTIN